MRLFGLRLLVFVAGCVGGFCCVTTVFAAELLSPNRQLYGMRAWGLGLSPVAMSVASAQTETLHHNPAWVGNESKASQKKILRGLLFPGLTLGANGTTRALGRAYFNGNSSTQRAIENFLKSVQNEQTPYAFLEMAPSITVLRLQWALFARVQVEGYVWQPTPEGAIISESSGTGRIPSEIFPLTGTASQMSVSALVERGTALSFSVPYKNTGVYLGFTARPTWRTEYLGQVSLAEPLIEETASNLRAKFNETRGIPVDFGMSVRLPRLSMRPMFGLKLEDVGDTYYRAVSSAHRDVFLKSNLSAGVSGWIFQDKNFASQCSLSGHHLNDVRVALNSVLGAGCELYVKGQVDGDVVIGSPFVVRLGYNKMGLAYGLSWDMPFAVIEVASQGVLIQGPDGTPDRRDRRYFLRLSVDVSQE